MQLRVAHLCLDCEEIFTGDSCPVCASERFAFLSTWLPVEERRRWQRSPERPATATQRRLMAIRRFFAEWLGDGEPVRPAGPPRTRASDHVPRFDLVPPAKPSTAERSTTESQPLKSDLR
jgi:hypothetical protein